MLFFQNHFLYLRSFFLALLFFLSSCQSSGQKNHDESDWSSRRKIPEYVMEELPSAPDTIKQTDHFQFFKYGDVNDTSMQAIIEKSEITLGKIEFFIGKQLNTTLFKWYFYPTSELKGLLLKNSTPCHIDFEKKEIHTVINDVFADHYFGKENELVLSALLGFSENYALQAGLAIYFSGKWQKMGYRYWSRKLHEANQLPELEILLKNQNWQHSSDLIFGSAAASFCEFLIDYLGKDVFFEKYKNGIFTATEIEDLEIAWQASLGEPIAFGIEAPPLPYLKGFNFAHEGYRIYNGYGSRKAEQSLDYIKEMGANAVAIVPYSFTRYPKKPHPIPVAKRAGSENDESVIQSSEHAQALGMSIVLKPQIWVGRGMWTGDIEMQSDADWDLFFKHYSHWISHYAMMAEIYNWEVLCLGTELVQTTLQREGDWRELIRDVRSLYNGTLTYAANWGDEFENISLWDELDFIGLNCYYPLSKKDSPSDRDLKKGFEAVIDKIRKIHKRYNKPIVFTEIGFPCIKRPWKEPHKDWGDFEHNTEHQRRCYETVFSCIKGEQWCKGILWWKYPSDLEHRRRRKTGFTPHGSPAENVVAKWFQQL